MATGQRDTMVSIELFFAKIRDITEIKKLSLDAHNLEQNSRSAISLRLIPIPRRLVGAPEVCADLRPRKKSIC